MLSSTSPQPKPDNDFAPLSTSGAYRTVLVSQRRASWPEIQFPSSLQVEPVRCHKDAADRAAMKTERASRDGPDREAADVIDGFQLSLPRRGSHFHFSGFGRYQLAEQRVGGDLDLDRERRRREGEGAQLRLLGPYLPGELGFFRGRVVDELGKLGVDGAPGIGRLASLDKVTRDAFGRLLRFSEPRQEFVVVPGSRHRLHLHDAPVRPPTGRRAEDSGASWPGIVRDSARFRRPESQASC